jgi:hypothetical protein
VPRLNARAVVLGVTVLASAVSFLRLGIPITIIVMVVGVTAAVLAGRYQAGRFKVGRRPTSGPSWQPAVQHQELPPPADDPVIGYPEPTVDQFATRMPPLAHLKLNEALRTQLDGFALGRAKRIIEAPDLLPHAAADAESWPVVEAAVQRTLDLARARGVQFNPQGQASMQKALALMAAQGVLLAEWRQLDDGRTLWEGNSAAVRASDAFTIQRITESMERRQLPDLFAGINKRPPDFEVRLLLPYALSSAFYMRLRGNPPNTAAA